ncbi:MAG: hypothetical protein DYH12_14025 [Sorangiineae bacterium PRO1]|nr:hypothetical protein [Sorangiineae bacterium PRO1]
MDTSGDAQAGAEKRILHGRAGLLLSLAMSTPAGAATDTLPAFSVRQFDPKKIYAEHVDGRRVIYLDSNIWIDLRDAKTDEARACREACGLAVDEGRAIFPLSYGSISEVMHNPSKEARERQADLMDALSLGVTFRAPHVVHALEGEAAYRYFYRNDSTPVSRSEVFTLVPDHVGDGRLEFPAGWKATDVARFLDYMQSETGWRTVRWLVDHLDHEEIARNHQLGHYESSMAEVVTKQRELARGESKKKVRARLLTEARVELFNQHVLPAIRRALIRDVGLDRMVEESERVQEEHGEGGPGRLAVVFQAATPSLELRAQLFAARALDTNGRPKATDFWDTEHASVAPIHADAFVTADGGLRTMLRAQKKLSGRMRAEILGSVHDLACWRGDKSDE